MHFFEYEHPNPRCTILLLHGLGTSASSWIHIVPALIKEHRVIAVDLPGFGSSRFKSGKPFFTLSEHCAALSALVDQMIRERSVLIGHSFGGWLSVRLAASQRHSFVRLVLVDTAGVYYPGAEELRRLFTIDSRASMRRLLEAMWYRYPWYFKPFTPAIYREMMKRKINSIVASVSEKDSLGVEFSGLTMPVHVIWGSEDRAISPAAVEVITRAVPHASVHFIERCGHVPQLERPEELRRIVCSILEGEKRGLD
jgi:pimeloyl-ACP methyl ester carboxylesterase